MFMKSFCFFQCMLTCIFVLKVSICYCNDKALNLALSNFGKLTTGEITLFEAIDNGTSCYLPVIDQLQIENNYDDQEKIQQIMLQADANVIRGEVLSWAITNEEIVKKIINYNKVSAPNLSISNALIDGPVYFPSGDIEFEVCFYRCFIEGITGNSTSLNGLQVNVCALWYIDIPYFTVRRLSIIKSYVNIINLRHLKADSLEMRQVVNDSGTFDVSNSKISGDLELMDCRFTNSKEFSINSSSIEGDFLLEGCEIGLMNNSRQQNKISISNVMIQGDFSIVNSSFSGEVELANNAVGGWFGIVGCDFKNKNGYALSCYSTIVDGNFFIDRSYLFGACSVRGVNVKGFFSSYRSSFLNEDDCAFNASSLVASNVYITYSNYKGYFDCSGSIIENGFYIEKSNFDYSEGYSLLAEFLQLNGVFFVKNKSTFLGGIDLMFSNIGRFAFAESTIETINFTSEGERIYAVSFEDSIIEESVVFKDNSYIAGMIDLYVESVHSIYFSETIVENVDSYTVYLYGNVKGHVYFNKGFISRGMVCVGVCSIDKYFEFKGCVLENADSDALYVYSSDIGHHFLFKECNVLGRVFLSFVQVGQSLSMIDSTYFNPAGESIFIKNSNFMSMDLTDGSVFWGSVVFRSCLVNVDAIVRRCKFYSSGVALKVYDSTFMGSLRVVNDVYLSSDFNVLNTSIDGKLECKNIVLGDEVVIDFSNSRVDFYSDDGSCWPMQDFLSIDGFEYNYISNAGLEDVNRLDWISLQSRFNPYSYEVLADAYVNSNDDRLSNEVLYKKRMIEFSRDAWNPLMYIGYISGFGYKPINSIQFLGAILIVGIFLSIYGLKSGAIVLNEKLSVFSIVEFGSADKVRSLAHVTSNGVHFYEARHMAIVALNYLMVSILFSFQYYIPIVSLFRIEMFSIKYKPMYLRFTLFHFVLILLGWLIATIFLATISSY